MQAFKKRGIKTNLKSQRASFASQSPFNTVSKGSLHSALMEESNFNRRDSKQAYQAAYVVLNWSYLDFLKTLGLSSISLNKTERYMCFHLSSCDLVYLSQETNRWWSYETLSVCHILPYNKHKPCASSSPPCHLTHDDWQHKLQWGYFWSSVMLQLFSVK